MTAPPLPKTWDTLPVFAPADAPEIPPETCDHCGSKFVAYERSISGSMCSALALLAGLDMNGRNPYWNEDPVQFPGDGRNWWPSAAFMRDYHGERISGGPHTYFRLWGLMDSKDRKGNNGKALHCISTRGRDYVGGVFPIPHACVERRQIRQHFVGPMVYFRECLGQAFDFDTLMQRAGLA